MKKGTKYLILLVVTFLLMELSGIVFIFISYFLTAKSQGVDYDTFRKSMLLLSYYYDNNVVASIGTTAKQYFLDNPQLFNLGTLSYSLVQFLSYLPVFIVAGIFLWKDLIGDFKRFGKNIKRNIVVILLSYAALIYLGNIVSMIYGLAGDTGKSANEGLINLLLTGKGKWLMIISVTLLAPLSEEIIFRKLIIDTTELKFRFKPWLAILVSALVFSFVHVTDIASLKYIFQYLALAVPICCAYHFSENNIVSSLIIHIINNTISVISTLALGGMLIK